MPTTTAVLVKQFITLEQKRRKKEDDLEEIKKELASLEQDLLLRFERAGTQKMTVNGHTVFIHRQLWAKAKGEPWLTVQALKDADLGELVEEKFNTHRLSAYVREQVGQAPPGSVLGVDDIIALLPKPLQGTVAVSEKFSLRSKKG